MGLWVLVQQTLENDRMTVGGEKENTVKQFMFLKHRKQSIVKVVKIKQSLHPFVEELKRDSFLGHLNSWSEQTSFHKSSMFLENRLVPW